MRVVLLLLLLLQLGQALAHAALLEAAPQDGDTVEASPEGVRLRFDEPVGLIALGLVGPGGAVAPLAPAVAEGDVVSARFPAGLPRGTYLLSWRVTSVDSHVVAGTIAFGVGVVPVAGSAAAEPWQAPSMVLRGVFLGALLLGTGGALFRLVAEPPAEVRAALAGFAWVGVGLAALQVGVRGAWLANAPTLLAAGPWLLGGGTTLAISVAVSAAGLAGCAVAWRRAGRGWSAAWALLALAGLPLSGHAGTADPRWVAAPALLLHGLAAAFWVGAFWPLLGLLRGAAPLPALRRFSAAAVPAVALLLLSGATLATVQLGHWSALIGSDYGRVLLLKLAVVAALLGAAGLNRQRLTPALAAGGGPGSLRASIRVELALAAAVLGATGVLGLTAPPRAEAARPAGQALWTQADGIGALIEVTPARAGSNEVAVTIDRAVPPREVWLELRQAAAGVAGVRRAMRLEGGRWVHAGPELALPGRWTIRVEALLTEFDQTTFSTETTIP